MVDPYAVVRRLTGHELISPKDARLLTEAVDGLIDEIGSKDARIAKLAAENERLREQITKATDPTYLEEKLRQIGVTDEMATEALSRTGAVKPLDEDDYEEIISAAAINMRKAASGTRGQVITVQDSIDWWVMKETERRVLSALSPAPEAQQERPSEQAVTEAGGPFVTFANHAIEKTDDGWVWRTSGNERICDWFGPSDFGALKAAMEAGR